jgi:hypothetical protein
MLEFRPDGSIQSVDDSSLAGINPLFLKRFQKAAALGDAGQPEQALAAYEQILAPFADPNQDAQVSGKVAEWEAVLECMK